MARMMPPVQSYPDEANPQMALIQRLIEQNGLGTNAVGPKMVPNVEDDGMREEAQAGQYPAIPQEQMPDYYGNIVPGAPQAPSNGLEPDADDAAPPSQPVTPDINELMKMASAQSRYTPELMDEEFAPRPTTDVRKMVKKDMRAPDATDPSSNKFRGREGKGPTKYNARKAGKTSNNKTLEAGDD